MSAVGEKEVDVPEASASAPALLDPSLERRRRRVRKRSSRNWKRRMMHFLRWIPVYVVTAVLLLAATFWALREYGR